MQPSLSCMSQVPERSLEKPLQCYENAQEHTVIKMEADLWRRSDWCGVALFPPRRHLRLCALRSNLQMHRHMASPSRTDIHMHPAHLEPGKLCCPLLYHQYLPSSGSVSLEPSLGNRKHAQRPPPHLHLFCTATACSMSCTWIRRGLQPGANHPSTGAHHADKRIQVVRGPAQAIVRLGRGGPPGCEHAARPPQQRAPDVLAGVRADRHQQQRGHLLLL